MQLYLYGYMRVINTLARAIVCISQGSAMWFTYYFVVVPNAGSNGMLQRPGV